LNRILAVVLKMRIVIKSVALGMVSLIALFFDLFLIRVPSLGRLFFEPGMLVGPLVMHVIPPRWGAGNAGEESRLLFVAVVNLSALANGGCFFPRAFTSFSRDKGNRRRVPNYGCASVSTARYQTLLSGSIGYMRT
jgi:hypothetical protein